MSRVYTFSSVNSLFSREPSRAMKEILDLIRSIALSDLGILIVGEEGTEKRWLAETIHSFSARAGEQCTAIDCANVDPASITSVLFGSEELALDGMKVTPGLLESANHGTLVLENVSHLKPAVVSELARVQVHRHFRRIGGYTSLETHARIITTMTLRPPANGSAVHEPGELYHRSSQIIINLPPLRERRDDILFLIERYLAGRPDASGRGHPGITTSALRHCLEYNWPGNAQELEAVVRDALSRSPDEVIRARHLPDYLRSSAKVAGKSRVLEPQGT